MMGAGSPCDVRNDLEIVTVRERDIPGDRLLKPLVKRIFLSAPPCIEDPDLQIPACRQSLIKRNIILDRMRDDERELCQKAVMLSAWQCQSIVNRSLYGHTISFYAPALNQMGKT